MGSPTTQEILAARTKYFANLAASFATASPTHAIAPRNDGAVLGVFLAQTGTLIANYRPTGAIGFPGMLRTATPE